MKSSPDIYYSTPPVDILIVDPIGLQQLSTCVPHGTQTQLLSLRGKTRYPLNFSFFKAVLKNAWVMLRHKMLNRELLILLAFIDYYQPKLILSLADNNKLLLKYASLSWSRPVYLVQNAIRRDYRAPFNFSRLPTYLVLGVVEEQRIEQRQILFDNVLPIGSIALDCALREFQASHHSPAEFGFISSYRPPNQPQDYDATLDTAIFNAHESLFLLTYRYALEHMIKLRVIIKARGSRAEIENEINYFETLVGSARHLEFCSTPRGSLQATEWGNYFAMLSSDLLVCGHSTLGFEAVSAGKKVLFGSSARLGFLKQLGIEDYFDHLPEQLKLTDESLDDFRSKISILRAIPNQEYLALTHNAPIRRQSDTASEKSSGIVRHLLSETLARA